MGKRQKQKQYQDKLKTHDFFGQSPCPPGCCCRGPPLDDTIGIPHPFPSLSRQEMNRKILYFEQVARSLPKLIEHEAQNPEMKEPWWKKPVTSWGLGYLDDWIEEITKSEESEKGFFKTFDESKHDETQRLLRNFREQRSDWETRNFVTTGDGAPFPRAWDNGKLPSPLHVVHEIHSIRIFALRCFQGLDFILIEKKFGYPNEDWHYSRTKWDQSGEFLGLMPQPICLFEMFNGPRTMPVKPAAEKNPRPRKQKTPLAALEEIKRHCKAITEEAQAINKSVSIDETPPPALPKEFSFLDLVVLSTYPEPLRSTLWDLKIVGEEISDLRPLLIAQKDLIDVHANIWFSANEGTFKFGKENIHQFPDFQKYEYMRTDLLALHHTKFTFEEKLLRILKKDRRIRKDHPETDAARYFQSFFQGNWRDKAEREAKHQKTIQTLYDRYGSVETVVQYVDATKEEVEKGMKTEGEVMKQIGDFLLSQRPSA